MPCTFQQFQTPITWNVAGNIYNSNHLPFYQHGVYYNNSLPYRAAESGLAHSRPYSTSSSSIASDFSAQVQKVTTRGIENPLIKTNSVASVSATEVCSDSHNSTTFYCEPCDKEFTAQDAFEAHKAMHENCGHPGCTFNGTKKVVNAHFLASHGTYSGTGYKDIDVEGQSFRVLMGTSPEEVEQWRAARRMRFPSAANVAAKLNQTEKLLSAGGLEPKGSKKFPKRQTSHQCADQRSRTTQSNSTSESKRNDNLLHLNGESASESLLSANRSQDASIPADVGTSLEQPAADMQPVEESQAATLDSGFEVKSHVDKKSICRNFLQGNCTKGDSCEFVHKHRNEMATCKFFLRGRCKMGKRCKNLHDAEVTTQGSARLDVGDGADGESRKRKRHELFLPKPLDGGARGTLLKKLLQDSIAEEENVILQCIRHFANRLREEKGRAFG